MYFVFYQYNCFIKRINKNINFFLVLLRLKLIHTYKPSILTVNLLLPYSILINPINNPIIHNIIDT